MKTRLPFAYLCLGFVLALSPACGDDGGGSGADASNNPQADAGNNPQADASTTGYQTLITGSFTIPAGEEIYRCARVTVNEDMYISAFQAIAPLGTHHTVVTIDTSGQPDGEFDCSAGTLSDQMIYASGVGTDILEFPPGVAMKVTAGQKILLNLHLFNTGETPITDVAGTSVKTIPVGDVVHEAEMLFAGPVQFTMGTGEQTLEADCTFQTAATIMTVWPHMHQYGTHMKVDHMRGGSLVSTIHDEPYTFYEQRNYIKDPVVQMNAGDKIHVTCTYMNTSGGPVSFGDSSEAEMCFAGLYRYPKTAAQPFCVF